MYSRILFPTDFGEHARHALQCTLQYRTVGLKEIILLHVIDVNELGWYASAQYLQLREEQMHELAAINFQELESLVREQGIAVSSLITTGIPSIEIMHTAKERQVSLIVGGSHRKRHQDEELLDTTTARIVRHSPIPVMVTRYHPAWEDAQKCAQYCQRQFSRLLVPVDWSDCAMKAVDYLVALKTPEPQEVIVAHVLDEHELEYADAQGIEEVRLKALERLEHTKARLALKGFDVKTHLHVGKPHREIARMAEEENVSLLVMGHHGKGWLKNLMVGSTTERVLRSTRVPVLVVNRIES